MWGITGYTLHGHVYVMEVSKYVTLLACIFIKSAHHKYINITNVYTYLCNVEVYFHGFAGFDTEVLFGQIIKCHHNL